MSPRRSVHVDLNRDRRRYHLRARLRDGTASYPQPRLKRESSTKNTPQRVSSTKKTPRLVTNAEKTPYSKLNKKSDDIRVFILQPGVGLDPLHGTLVKYRLDCWPEFEALSYAWGDPAKTTPVFINDSRIMVSHNLGVALQHLRHSHSSRNLWIDALCINQEDLEERNHQVFLMNRIYATADHVLVWLGEDRNRSHIAMDRLKTLAEGDKLDVNESRPLREFIYPAVIDREWWGRLWVVQEVVLAKSEPTIICGSKSLPWNSFMRGCEAVHMTMLMVENERISIKCGLQHWLQGLRQNFSSETYGTTRLPLTALLTRTKPFRTSDSRDKIFGCLGLVGMADREALKPDYQKPTQLVYWEVSKYLLGNTSAPFFSCFSFSDPRKSLGPSWVPDFAAQESLTSSDPFTLRVRHGVPYLVHDQRRVSFQESGHSLCTKGISFDVIETAIELNSDPLLLIAQIPALERLMNGAIKREFPPDFQYFSELMKPEDTLPFIFGKNYTDYPEYLHQYNVITGQAKPPQGQSALDFARSLLSELKLFLSGGYYFITKMGFVGLAVTKVCKNDRVTVLFGEILPIILRPRFEHYRVIGAAYVSGIMNGELLKLYEEGFVKEAIFTIQ